MNSQSKYISSARIVNLLLLLTVLVVSLLLSELFVRYFYPQRLYYNVSQWDSYVGWTAIPNIEGISANKDYTMHIKINSRGLRDREFPYIKPQNTVRIGIFGDSFTFGEGVEADETYPKILEDLLNDEVSLTQGKYRVEVLNFGIGKTGTSHQLAWYRKEGRKYQLDFVILGFLSGNDFTDNWGGVFYLKDNKLVHNPAAYSSIRRIQKIVYSIPFYRWLALNSHLVNLARKTVTIIDDRVRIKSNKNLSKEGSEDESELESNITYLTLRLIKELRKEANSDGSQFLMVNLPAKHQKFLPDYSENEKVKPYIVRYDRLLKELRKTNIKLLDLIPVFVNLPVSKYYFEHDGHMTKFGHQVIASNIHKYIMQDVGRLLH